MTRFWGGAFSLLILLIVRPVVASPSLSPALSSEQIAGAKATLMSSVFAHSYGPQIEGQLLRLLQNRSDTEAGFARCAQYAALIQKEFHARGVPDEMSVIPFVESRCENKMRNKNENGGIWSFSRFTAALYDLGSELGTDDRLDTMKETVSAADFLDEENRQIRDWSLVILSYRYGNGAVKDLRKKLKSTDPIRLQKALSKEAYYEQIVAAFILTKNLKLFGF